MITTFTFKTDKKLHREAKETAKELGLPLTTIINALLRQFVREGKFSVEIEPSLTNKKITLWGKISKEMDENSGVKFKEAKNLIKHLKI